MLWFANKASSVVGMFFVQGWQLALGERIRMWVFLCQIPKGTTREELGRFASKGLKPPWMFFPFPSIVKVKRCEILQIFDPETKTTEYHGLVQTDPSKAALQVIERLNGRELQGKLIEVREYFHRSSHRDRRHILSEGAELPRQDRRRDRLKSRVLHAPELERVLCNL